MWKIILYGLLAWFLYNLVFRFIIPVYKASKQVKQQFREMQDRMQEQVKQQQTQQRQQATPPPVSKSTTSKRNDDYIDFEEVK